MVKEGESRVGSSQFEVRHELVEPGDFAVVDGYGAEGNVYWIIPKPIGRRIKEEPPDLSVLFANREVAAKKEVPFPELSSWLDGSEASSAIAQKLLALHGGLSHVAEGAQLNVRVSRKEREQVGQSVEEARKFLAGEKPGVLITSFAMHEALLRMAEVEMGTTSLGWSTVDRSLGVHAAGIKGKDVAVIDAYVDAAVAGGRWRELPEAVRKGRGADPRSSGWRAEEKAAGVLKTEILKINDNVYLVRDDFDYDPNRIKGSKFYVVKI